MNSIAIQETIAKCLFNVQNVKEKIVRGEKRDGDRPYAAVFVDYSENVLGADFDVIKYQDECIAQSYYASGTSLQWDHYLLFVISSENAISGRSWNDRRKAIENDTHYARKHVVTDLELQRFLLGPLGIKEEATSAKVEGDDPYIRWIRRLSVADLDGIFMRDPATDIVRKYLAGTPIKESGESSTSSANSLRPAAKKLELLRIEQSERVRPLAGDYPLAPVTLLFGPNGAGKTSFLEAIELSLCGTSSRNPRTKEAHSKLSVRFSGETQFEVYEPGNLSKYRQRDLQWYGNRYDRDNRIHESFAKYNFFDTDNAVRLATDDKRPADLRNAFVALTLGEQINYLDERMDRVLQLFQREHSVNDKSRIELEKRVSDITVSIKGLSEPDPNVERQFHEFQKSVSLIQWKNPAPIEPRVTYPEFETGLNRLISGVELITRQLSWLPNASLKKIEIEVERTNIAVNRLKEITEGIEKCKINVGNDEKIQKEAKEKSALLSKGLAYIEIPAVATIVGLSGQIAESERHLANLSQAAGTAASVKTEKIRDVADTVAGYAARMANEQRNVQPKYEDASRALEQLKAQAGATQRIVADLKSRGHEYLDQHPSATDCPLCGSHYDRAELLRRILAETVNFESSEEFKLAVDAERILRRSLEDYRERAEATGKLKEALSFFLEPNQLLAMTVNDGCVLIKELPDMILKERGKIGQLREKRAYFESMGVSEAEFNMLHQGLVLLGMPMTPEEKSNISNALAKIATDLGLASGRLDATAKELSGFQHEVHELAYAFSRSELDSGALNGFLIERQSSLASVMAKLVELEGICILGRSNPVNELKTQLTSIEISLTRFKNSKKDEAQKSELLKARVKEEVDVKESLLAVNKVLQSSKRAMDAIEDLRNNDGKEKNLKAFLDKYRAAIVNVFSRIHTPHEFDDLSIEDSEILLRRKSNGEKVELTKISTGQRAALALSIFLTLHVAAPYAPPILLIDDPVAHVDDLNTLAFLDYLRELVVHGGRQVIFATADNKLGKLFEKKFSFLEKKDFQKYALVSE